MDGDWRNNAAHNLTLLCPSCHSLTPTYRALNRGNGCSHRLGGQKRGADNVLPRQALPQQCYEQGMDRSPKQLGLF